MEAVSEMETSEVLAALLGNHDGSTRIAVVGASLEAAKYGHIITADLLGLGYTVLPIHPSEPEILGQRCYPRVEAAPGPVHIVNFVVPPAVTLRTLATLAPERFPIVWFQPGSFDGACEAEARRRGFAHVLAGDCIMVVARWH